MYEFFIQNNSSDILNPFFYVQLYILCASTILSIYQGIQSLSNYILSFNDKIW